LELGTSAFDALDQVPSNNPAARAELILGKKSLFDAVPFHQSPLRPRGGFDARRLNRRK
jgi:hypothetical protein